MDNTLINDYGSLCTEMYEILHPAAPQDELDFYLSYAKPGSLILEPLCGSGRFLVPMLERGMTIHGMDLSACMLAKLREKAPDACVTACDVLAYQTDARYDYIFISSGSVSLFTDMQLCRRVLARMKALLAPSGVFVFAVDTVANRCPERDAYKEDIRVKTAQGHDLVLLGQAHYDEATQTQFSPSLYALYDGDTLLRQEPMDFRTHLYKLGEMEDILRDIGFAQVSVYASYDKTAAASDDDEMFLYECRA